LYQTDNAAFIDKYACMDIYWMLLDNPFTNQFMPEKASYVKQSEEWCTGKIISTSQIEDVEPPPDSPEGMQWLN